MGSNSNNCYSPAPRSAKHCPSGFDIIVPVLHSCNLRLARVKDVPRAGGGLGICTQNDRKELTRPKGRWLWMPCQCPRAAVTNDQNREV